MNTEPTRVFVVHENLSMNFSDAERFGEVRFITNREWNPRRGSMTNGETFDAIRTKMFNEYRPGKDFLILNGPPVILGFAFHIAMLMSHRAAPGVCILSWDKRAGKYIEGMAEMPLTQIEAEEAK
jgi:hypothetical protein